jgi:hypothetical protein
MSTPNPSAYKKMLLSCLVLSFIASARAASQGEPAKAPPTCGCADEFDSLVQKVEADYLGYHQLLPTMDLAQYREWKAALRAQAARASDEECFAVVSRYTDRFRDGHLFVSEQPSLSAAEAAAAAARAEVTQWSESRVREYLVHNASRLDPLEGIWYSDKSRFGIVRDRVPARRDFIGVLLSDGVENWKPGQVKAEFVKEHDGSYKARYFYGDHALHHLHADLDKRLLLRMPPVIWGKSFPIATQDVGLLDPNDPRNPAFKALSGAAVVISMPSHSGEYRPRLEQLIAQHLEQIRAAQVLIVDLRGNEGGGAQTSDPLEPFYDSDHHRSRPDYAGKEAVVSSPDQIAYFEALAKNMGSDSFFGKRFTALVQRMRDEPGRVIATDIWKAPGEAPEKAASISANPRHFAILMDRLSESAAEAFVLTAWTSSRVELFGDNSNGTSDYQSVAMVPLACPRHSLWVGYPTIGASEFLPKQGFNGVGIPPDVRIPSGVADPFQWIADYYRRLAHD